MRIISGEFRSRKIECIKNNSTRPTMDKVREAIYNIIGPYFDGGIALDLFAGTGSLGLEGLSRGFEHCYFIDSNNEAINTIKRNISSLKVDSRTTVIKNDYFKALIYFKKNKVKFDYIFLDPPYKNDVISDIINYVYMENLLNKDALIIAEHDKNLELDTKLPLYKEAVYGIMKISIFERND